MSDLIVGTNHISYLEKRNFIDLPYSEEISYKKVIDIYKFYNYFLFKARNKVDPNYQFSFRDYGFNKVDLFHFFSTVYFGKKPWIMTTSVPVPRWTHSHKKGIEALEKVNCKAIIMMSENCLEKQKSLLKKNNVTDQSILSKIHILHPAQSLLIDSIEAKNVNPNKLVFTVIGHQFLIKGGLEIVRVFKKLHENSINNIELNIVSLLHKSEFLDYDGSHNDLKEIREIIRETPIINHYPSLNNTDVLELLKSTDVSLLPSYGDSYGYSVLEAQAAGCPVITTDTGALPEINNNEIGWIIKVPLKEERRADVGTDEKRAFFSKQLELGLYEIINEILTRQNDILIKANACLVKIKEKHHPKDRAEAIQKLYLAALNS